MDNENPIRELLNEHKWALRDLGELTITVLHRGAEGNVRVIKGSAIEVILGRGFTVSPLVWELKEGESNTYVPFHRVIMVEKEGEVLYPVKARRKDLGF